MPDCKGNKPYEQLPLKLPSMQGVLVLKPPPHTHTHCTEDGKVKEGTHEQLPTFILKKGKKKTETKLVVIARAPREKQCPS